MLLQRLVEYSGRLDLPPSNYVERAVHWFIDLDAKGKFKGMQPTGDFKDRQNLKHLNLPHVMRSVAVRAKLLSDNGEYVLGTTREGGKPGKVRERHESFVATVRACAEATGFHDVKAALNFLESLDVDSFPLPEDFDPSHEITFRVDGRLPVDHPQVRDWWASTFEDPGAQRMQCIVCGRQRTPEKRLQQKIKRIPGGQMAGNALISANSPAFESYALHESLIAPTCSECAEKFSHAANHLLTRPDTHIRIDPVVYIFWTKEDVGFDGLRLLSNPEPEDVKALIRAVFTGAESPTREDCTPFYAAALTASGARVAVRDWLDTTVGGVKRALARYFRLMQIVDFDGSEGKPLNLYQLSGATVRDLKDLPAHVPRGLIRFALAGGRLPKSLLFEAVRRNRAEQRVTRPRAALIKMVMLSHGASGLKEEDMVQLDNTNKEPAYLCGRLFALLEKIQREALGSVGASIVDRFYGSASSAPASVFGNLMRGSQAHLTKLRKTKPGLHVTFQKQLEEVAAHLAEFPLKLTLQEQGLFALGYYFERPYRKPKGEEAGKEE